MNENYLMRSLMFVPAHNQKLLDSSVRRDADVLLLDVEDSVPVFDKQLARDNIKTFVQRDDLNGKLIFPRINDRESGELLKYLTQLTVEGVHGFMYPKSTKGEDESMNTLSLKPLSTRSISLLGPSRLSR